MKAGELLQELYSRLGDATHLDAQLLAAHALDRPRSWLLAHLDADLSPSQADSARSAFAKYQSGKPLPYLLGHWEFYGLDFDVTEDVLIPRPETELLVEKAVAWLQASPQRRTLADIGTGSGAIAASIAMNVPGAYILATDVSMNALKLARSNAQKFHVHHRIDFLQCDLLPHPVRSLATDRYFDLICANLPYIPTAALKQLPIYGREPTLALDGGTDGLDLYRKLFQFAPQWLAPQGMMLLEIESTLGVKTLSLAFDYFSDVNIQLHRDLAGKDRLLEIRFL